MKTEYAKVFVGVAAAKVIKANALGSKTTWTTEDHLKACAESIANAVDPQWKENDAELSERVRDVLADTYNVSAFAQYLAKKFEGTGHFVRAEKKAKTVNELDAMLDAALAGK
jgi:hypothetical protein